MLLPSRGGVAAPVMSREASEAVQTGAERKLDSAQHKEWSLTSHVSRTTTEAFLAKDR